MHLILTSYVDRSPDHVHQRLAASIPHAVREAAERICDVAGDPITSIAGRRAVLRGGLADLDGASIDWDGTDDLTTVRITVPWATNGPGGGRQILAANRFAQTLTTDVRAPV